MDNMFAQLLMKEIKRLEKIEAAARAFMQYHSMYGNGKEALALGEALGMDKERRTG